MTAVEFNGVVDERGQIALPVDVASQIPPGEQLHVVVMWDGPESDAAWRMVGRAAFASAYAPQDSVYEDLINDLPIR
jgi:hypothetical protein